MKRRFVASYVAMAIVVVAGLEIPLGLSYARTERERFTVGLERDAGLIGSLVEDELEFGDGRLRGDIAAQVASFPGDGRRLAVVDEHGRLIHPRGANEVASLPEPLPGVADALAGHAVSGAITVPGAGSGAHVTVPVSSGGVLHGAVYLDAPLTATDARILRMWLILAALAVTILLVTALVGAAVARWAIQPIRELTDAVSRFADGHLDVRAPTGHGPPEERDLARRFNAMAAKVGHLIAMQRSFVSDASHQLRSPLAALRLGLEELERARVPVSSDGIERAIRETQRMSRLVTDLLALARAEAATSTWTVEDATAVLRYRAATWEPLAAEAGVRLVVREGETCHVEIVSGALEQIVDNLLDNAIEASPRGATVHLWSIRNGDDVEIHVVDEGRGIDEETRTRAFDRFWRAPDARPGTGTGLGLAIVRQLARASGGEAYLRPGTPVGTDAVVVLAATSTTRQASRSPEVADAVATGSGADVGREHGDARHR